jgi:hypothetical protein
MRFSSLTRIIQTPKINHSFFIAQTIISDTCILRRTPPPIIHVLQHPASTFFSPNTLLIKPAYYQKPLIHGVYEIWTCPEVKILRVASFQSDSWLLRLRKYILLPSSRHMDVFWSPKICWPPISLQKATTQKIAVLSFMLCPSLGLVKGTT